jgi:hypothetical protein
MSNGNLLKTGEVVRIRVNPTDTLSVLDLLAAVGISTTYMSYSQCVSLALSSLLETARQHKLIPEPDGFDYNNRMAKFRGHNSLNHKKKLETNAAIERLGSDFKIAHAPKFQESPEVLRQRALDATSQRQPNEAAAQQMPLSEDERYARQRLTELCAKRDAAEDNTPGILWSDSDEAEFQKLYKVVYPNG